MVNKPKILLVNDDGVYAPGLTFLARALANMADLTIVAPASDRSGSATSVSWKKPLYLEQVPREDGIKAYSVSGTPADCVKIALTGVYDEPPVAVLSGINNGTNAGRNVFYSGTVGAAIEAAQNGIPAAALSCLEPKTPNFDVAAHYAPWVLAYLMRHKLPRGTVLNINVPDCPLAEVKGLRIARQGRSYWKESPSKRAHPQGVPYFWLGGEHLDVAEQEESDIALLQRGYVAVVPLYVAELTNHQFISSSKESLEGFFAAASHRSNDRVAQPPQAEPALLDGAPPPSSRP